MDKYEFNLKIEQIQKLVKKKDYQTASKIAKGLDLRRVKDWQSLALLIQVHDSAGELEEAREVSVIAYNKNLGGRRLVYKLADICLRLKDYDEANELYKDYVKMAPRDPSRYVLEYKILKAQGADPDELIDVLEIYREHEIDEKYLCELAYLYSTTGRNEECVEECDEIITLFRDGVYVERAIALKKQYAALSPAQQKILDEAEKKAARKSLAEATGEKLDEEDEQPMRRQETREMDLSGIFNKVNEESEASEDEESEGDASDDEAESNKKSKFRAFIDKTFGGDEDDEDDEEEDASEEELEDVEDFEANEEPDKAEDINSIIEEQEASDDKQVVLEEAVNNVWEVAEEQVEEQTATVEQEVIENIEEVKPVQEMVAKTYDSIADNIAVAPINSAVEVSTDTSEYAQSKAAISAASASIQQMIEAAKNKVDTNYDELQKQAEEEKKADELSSISVPVQNYGVYDTQTLQTELINSMNELFGEENKAEAADEDSQKVEVDIREEGQEMEAPEEQIEGQLSIEDWIEVIREEKYSKQRTKEFSREELEIALERREREHQEYESLKAKVEYYEDPIRKQRAELEKMIINSVKTDLAIRTGKATAKLEQDVIKLREERKAREEAERLRKEQEMEAAKRYAEEAKKLEQEAIRIAELEKAKEELRKKEEEIERLRAQEEELRAAKAVEDAIAEEAKQVAATVEQDSANKKYSEEGMAPMALPEAVKKYFKKYEDVEDLEKILVGFYTESVLRHDSKNSASGNVIISGNHNTDKTGLAMSIIKGLNVLFPENPRKVARTTGESINSRGIEKVVYKLKGTALVVEDAGSLTKERVTEMLRVLDTETDNMLVILEDSNDDIDALLRENPGITEKFNHKIELKYLTVNEMVQVAKSYALEQGYMIAEEAILALYLAMDKLNSASTFVENDDIYEYMDEVMNRTDKRTHKKFFGRKKSDSTSMIIESDFDAE